MKLKNEDCVVELKKMTDNSVDSIVTDPPYELGFMGKKWDSTGIAYNVDLWKECLRVLKPGGHLLAFGGSRTYHRMAVAIEDAGFEVRDMLEWIYACVSDDTEILTEKGFRHLYKTKQNDRIAVYDNQKNIYKWEVPERWNKYNIQQDTLYRIKSDNTDQIVTGNHRVLVEREGKLVFIQAKKCSEMELVPYLQDDFHFLPKRQFSLLLKLLQWKSPFKSFSGESKDKSSKMVGGKETKSTTGNDGGEKQGMERWFDLQEAKREVCRPVNKICQMSERLFGNGKTRWLCNGTQIESGDGNKKTTEKNGGGASLQSRCNRQQDRELNAIQDERGAQKIRTRSEYKTTLATITPITYSGKVFCPTVSTGAWVARRNGKIFITGNSGFPKSLNVGKAVDRQGGRCLGSEVAEIVKQRRIELGYSTIKLAELGKFYGETNHGGTVSNWETGRGSITVEQYNKLIEILKLEDNPVIASKRDYLGSHNFGASSIYGSEIYNKRENGKTINITKGSSEWEGFGTALKPAHEPICMARKPLSEKTIVENVLKHGTGAIDIDGCRIPIGNDKPTTRPLGRSAYQKGSGIVNGGIAGTREVESEFGGGHEQGRFPANIIVTNDALNDGEMTKGSIGRANRKSAGDYNASNFKVGVITETETFDSGSKSRYFDIDCWAEKHGLLQFPKASKRERNEGCEGLPIVKGGSMTGKEYREGKPTNHPERQNFHPTVKPVHLMSWLVRLVTPKDGICLDPFMGSGTTGVACKKLDRDFIGIELDKNYFEIAKQRINSI